MTIENQNLMKKLGFWAVYWPTKLLGWIPALHPWCSLILSSKRDHKVFKIFLWNAQNHIIASFSFHCKCLSSRPSVKVLDISVKFQIKYKRNYYFQCFSNILWSRKLNFGFFLIQKNANITQSANFWYFFLKIFYHLLT